MTDRNNNEVFSKEELAELNNTLKKNEKIKLPESLSDEKIEEKLKNIVQDEAEVNEVEPKRKNKKRAMRVLAIAASLVIVFSSVMIIKPWKTTPKPVLGNGGKTAAQKVDDYSEIEKMFAEYSEKYKKYQNSLNRNGFYGFYKSTDTVEAEVAYEGALNGSAPGLQTKNTASPAVDESATANVNNSNKSANENYGTTNEQVQGVNEADIIKNDGKYLYVTVPCENRSKYLYYNAYEYRQPEECKVAIIETLKDGTFSKTGTAKILPEENSDVYSMSVREIYVKDSKLTVLLDCFAYLPEPGVNDETTETPSQKTEEETESVVSDGEVQIETEEVYNNGYYGDVSRQNNKNETMAVCFDITDKSSPKELWRVKQDGSYISSRMNGNELVIISDYYVQLYGMDDDMLKENCIPKATDENGVYSRVKKDNICIMERVCDSGYLVSSVTDVEKGSETFKASAVLGGGENVYCTSDTLYVTSSQYDYGKEEELVEIFGVAEQDLTYTQIYRFDISNCDIKYTGSGAVKGRALNQFSIDEYNGYLRIATTVGWWGDSLKNFIYVLDGDFNIAGSIENIAKGETIKSVRFTGDTGYVVTFEQTDPLFVIDLSKPEKPEITGELKIPGFSNYLHPVTDTLVLGIGVDGDENGAGNGMKVSLFDVSDPKAPKEASQYVINGKDEYNNDGSYSYSYVDSRAFYDHKAVCWDSENSVMYIPFEKSFDEYNPNTGVSKHGYSLGAMRISVDTENKTVGNTADYEMKNRKPEEYGSSDRVTYIGSRVYCLDNCNGVIYSFDMASAEQLSEIKL